MMKKNLCVLLALVCSLGLFAQEDEWKSYGRNDLKITYGAPSWYPIIFEVANMFGEEMLDVIIQDLGLESKHKGNYHYFGNVGLQYHYQVAKWCRVGASFNWDGSYSYYYNDKEHNHRIGKRTDNFITMMASCQFTYLHRKYVRLYSGVELGTTCWLSEAKYDDPIKNNKDKAYWMLGANVTLIGVNAGGPHVYGIAELNVGAASIIDAGIGFRF